MNTIVFRKRNSDTPADTVDKTLYENAVKARDEERTQRQELSKKFAEMEARLAEIDKAKQDETKNAEEKKLKEKQKFDELEQKWLEEKNLYESKIKELEPIAKQFTDFQTNTLNDLKGKIPEAKKDFVEKLITGKSIQDQLSVLPDIIKELSAGNFGGSPDKAGQQSQQNQTTDVSDAKTLDEAIGMIFAKKKS